MANEVYKVEEVTLDDGSKVLVKPSPIKILRKGTQMITELGRPDSEEEAIHSLLDIVCLCLKKQRPDFEKEEDQEDGSKRTVTNYDLMEEIFDIDTVFYVIEKDLGVKLNDPKLMEITQEQVEAMEEALKEQDSTS
jgi:hypothetical protein